MIFSIDYWSLEYISDVFKLLVLSEQQHKTYKYSVYNGMTQSKAANPEIKGEKEYI